MAAYPLANSTGPLCLLFPSYQLVSHPAAVGLTQPLIRDAQEASASKEEGNRFFKAGDLDAAVRCYTRALDLCPFGEDSDYARSVYHGNRAQCYLSLKLYQEAIYDCDDAIHFQPRFLKALMRRAQAKEQLDQLEDALADIKAVLEIDPTVLAAVQAQQRLSTAVKEKQEKMKEEMLGKLKDLGNTLLGKVGLSLDNFKMQQDPNTGSYSINFQQ